MRLRVGIVLLGCGSVGESVAIRLWRNQDTLEIKSGVHYDLRAIGVRNANRERAACLRAGMFSTNPRDIIDDPMSTLSLNVLGETIEAAELVEYALDRWPPCRNGKQRIVGHVKARAFRPWHRRAASPYDTRPQSVGQFQLCDLSAKVSQAMRYTRSRAFLTAHVLQYCPQWKME